MSAVEPHSEVTKEPDPEDFSKEECVEKTTTENGYVGQAQLLDLSDDVLLYILRYCAPHDLKALGFTCPRLGSLVLERSLWTVVDARGVCTGRSRMRWLMQALHAGTRQLQLTGFAKQAKGCQGHVNRTRKEVEDDKRCCGDFDQRFTPTTPAAGGNMLLLEPPMDANQNGDGGLGPPYPLCRQHARLHMNAHLLPTPRRSSSISWPEEPERDDPGADASQEADNNTGNCTGPVFTFSADTMKELAILCPRLTTLSLEYCNINCNKIGPSNFPRTIKRLSLRGTRCYNTPLDKSYLFRINDYLPALEYLDVSECSWLEPASLLPLSKLARLRTLLMRDCPAMAEFVAYVSLATRYGFLALQVLDVRGSPLSDSEVSALGWLPALRELYLSAPSATPEGSDPAACHRHYSGDPPPPPCAPRARQPWEAQIPYYYRSRYSEGETGGGSSSSSPESLEDVEAQVEIIRQRLHHPTQQFSIGIQGRWKTTNEENKQSPENQNGGNPNDAQKRSIHDQTDENTPGPSKRAKTDTQNEPPVTNNTSPTKSSQNTSPIDTVSSIAALTDTTPTNTDSSRTERVTETAFDNRTSETETNSSQETSKPKKKHTSLCDFHEDDKTLELLRNEYKKFKFKIYSNDGAASNTDNDRTSESRSPKPGPSNEADEPSTSKDKNKDKIDKENNPNEEVDTVRIFVSDRVGSVSTEEPNQSQEPPRDNITKDQESQDKTYQYKIDVNDGASTSRYSVQVKVNDEEPSRKKRRLSQTSPEGSSPEIGDDKTDESIPEPSGSNANEQHANAAVANVAVEPPRPQYVRFRRNQDPIVIQCPGPVAQRLEQEIASPRHQVLYVTLGQQLHAVYRLMPQRTPQSHRAPHSPEHLQASSLVTDSSIRRFGRADGEDINILNIGPNGPQFGGRDNNGRPNRSSLRILSATGYRNITNRSLIHLATAAPHLEQVDFTNTGVTETGVDNFKTLRPDVEVKFSTFKSEDVEE